MTPHGLDYEGWEKISNMDLKPAYIDSTFFFLVETSYMFKINKSAFEEKRIIKNIQNSWAGFKNNFNADKKEPVYGDKIKY